MIRRSNCGGSYECVSTSSRRSENEHVNATETEEYNNPNNTFNNKKQDSIVSLTISIAQSNFGERDTRQVILLANSSPLTVIFVSYFQYIYSFPFSLIQYINQS